MAVASAKCWHAVDATVCREHPAGSNVKILLRLAGWLAVASLLPTKCWSAATISQQRVTARMPSSSLQSPQELIRIMSSVGMLTAAGLQVIATQRAQLWNTPRHQQLLRTSDLQATILGTKLSAPPPPSTHERPSTSTRAAAPERETVSVQVPAGARAGDRVKVQFGENGDQSGEVRVPAGLEPGQTFRARAPLFRCTCAARSLKPQRLARPGSVRISCVCVYMSVPMCVSACLHVCVSAFLHAHRSISLPTCMMWPACMPAAL